jgi:hypothetical protein
MRQPSRTRTHGPTLAAACLINKGVLGCDHTTIYVLPTVYVLPTAAFELLQQSSVAETGT